MHLYYIYVGNYYLPLDHFVLVRSDTLTLEVTMGIRADHAMITCFGWRDVWALVLGGELVDVSCSEKYYVFI